LLCSTKDLECSCESCKKFKVQDHPDYLCFGRKNKIKVADIDVLLEFVSTTAFISDRKVIILDNAHIMSLEASNRLLKVLEEPPPYVTFILITSSPELLLSTVLSRCIKYEFESLSREDLTNIIWKKLGFDLPKAQILGWVASNSSVDVFSDAGKCLICKDMAFNFISILIKNKSQIDLLDIIDRVPKEDLPIFSDMVTILLTDILMLKNGYATPVNTDVIDEMKKFDVGDKSLLWALSHFSQVKKNWYLNVDLNMVLKNASIKSWPAFKGNS